MKKLFWVIILVSTLIAFSPAKASASTNDFYFSDSTFDYYLSKNADNSSQMQVIEVLTAVFPETNQNHGIERCIPQEFRGVHTLNTFSFTVTRNGTTEPYSTSTEDDMTCFRIGKADTYVHGKQVYKISYTLNNVILEPTDATNQELYWDTNGTGWYQKFERLTATVHLSSDIAPAFLGKTSCYVGRYGISGSAATSRCVTSINSEDNTITFFTKDLQARETLTLDLEFKPETFYVPKDPTPYIMAGICGTATLGVIIRSIITRKKAKKRNAEKISIANQPKPVQYTPPHDLSVAQAKQVWMGTSTADSKVASLMELAVHHSIELEKFEKESRFLKIKSNAWKIHVKNVDGISREQLIVLEILNQGASVHAGDVIEVKTQSYSSRVSSLIRDYTKDIEADLRGKNLFESDKNKKTYILAPKYNKYEQRTIKGIEASNYLDGLKEYIALAEKDRIAFLHSVKGADTSHQGIVKLYEKLLPYAIIFGCEESWLQELNKYYQLPDVEDPDWLTAGMLLSTSDFHQFSTSTMSSVASATASSDSGGSSGGGGGGFSGGGGGGGGGGGW